MKMRITFFTFVFKNGDSMNRFLRIVFSYSDHIFNLCLQEEAKSILSLYVRAKRMASLRKEIMKINLSQTQDMQNKTGIFLFCVCVCVCEYPFFSVFFFSEIGFVCRSYAGAAKAVHASSIEASCYYQLPCFVHALRNISERYHIYNTIHM